MPPPAAAATPRAAPPPAPSPQLGIRSFFSPPPPQTARPASRILSAPPWAGGGGGGGFRSPLTPREGEDADRDDHAMPPPPKRPRVSDGACVLRCGALHGALRAHLGSSGITPKALATAAAKVLGLEPRAPVASLYASLPSPAASPTRGADTEPSPVRRHPLAWDAAASARPLRAVPPNPPAPSALTSSLTGLASPLSAPVAPRRCSKFFAASPTTVAPPADVPPPDAPPPPVVEPAVVEDAVPQRMNARQDAAPAVDIGPPVGGGVPRVSPLLFEDFKFTPKGR